MICPDFGKIVLKTHEDAFLPLDEATAFRAVIVVVSGSERRADGNAFGTS